MKSLWLYLKSFFTKVYVQYWHHGRMNWVRLDLKGKHRQMCLCYDCAKFKPNSPDNCHIAKCTYANCVTFNTVTPIVECPQFEKKTSSGGV